MEIKLPDYLPSRYKNWLDLYLDVVKVFNESEWPINEETTVKLYEMADYDEQRMFLMQYGAQAVHFYQEFPLTLIKSRALDQILPNLPTKDEIYHMQRSVLSGMPAPNIQKNIEKLDQLMTICPNKNIYY